MERKNALLAHSEKETRTLQLMQQEKEELTARYHTLQEKHAGNICHLQKTVSTGTAKETRKRQTAAHAPTMGTNQANKRKKYTRPAEIRLDRCPT